MSESIKIINNAFTKAGGVGEYKGLTMPDSKNTPTSLRSMLGIAGREYIRFANLEINVIVMEYRETKEELLLVALFENYINMIIHIAKKYQSKASSIRRMSGGGSYVFEDDLIQESLIVLDKCLGRYVIFEDRRSSFSSYFIGELRNHLIETCRKSYFDVVKVPSTVYKAYRKVILNTDTLVPQNELGMYQRSGICISEYDENTIWDDKGVGNKSSIFFDDLTNAESKTIEILKASIRTQKDFIIFCLANGIGCEKIKSVEIANMLGVSKPAISKRLKKIREKLKKAKDVKAIRATYANGNNLEPIKKTKDK